MTYGEFKQHLEAQGITDEHHIISLAFEDANPDPWWFKMFVDAHGEQGFTVYQQPEFIASQEKIDTRMN